MPLDFVALTFWCKTAKAVLCLWLGRSILLISLGVQGSSDLLCELISEVLQFSEQSRELVLLLGFLGLLMIGGLLVLVLLRAGVSVRRRVLLGGTLGLRLGLVVLALALG